MDNKLKNIGFSFVKTFEYLLDFCPVFLLIYGIFLFDSLEIMVYSKGILDTDFPSFFNLSAIPFFLLFLVTFGIIATILSSLARVIVFKFCVLLFFKTKSKQKTAEKPINVGSLYEIALITENAFLLEYIENEIKSIRNVKRNHRILYSLSIALILNFFVMVLYDKKTILDFIICVYMNNERLFIKICLTLLLVPVILTTLVGIRHSVIFDDKEIYFPDAKYKLLNEETKSLLNKK